MVFEEKWTFSHKITISSRERMLLLKIVSRGSKISLIALRMSYLTVNVQHKSTWREFFRQAMMYAASSRENMLKS
jgi:hypothetical protein